MLMEEHECVDCLFPVSIVNDEKEEDLNSSAKKEREQEQNREEKRISKAIG